MNKKIQLSEKDLNFMTRYSYNAMLINSLTLLDLLKEESAEEENIKAINLVANLIEKKTK